MSKRFGFGIGEVLATIVIIGALAVLTISPLIKNYQKQQTATRLEKAFSVINQAVQMSEVENGPMESWKVPSEVGKGTYDSWWWNTYFVPYANLSVIKICDDAHSAECWSTKTVWLDGQSMSACGGSKYVLKDGMIFSLEATPDGWSRIYVDVNGLSAPNVMGKDIFTINIMYKQSKVVFEGNNPNATAESFYANGSCMCNKSLGSQKGLYCGVIIQRKGWVIPPEYPWD